MPLAYSPNPMDPVVATTGDSGAKTVNWSSVVQTNSFAKGALIVIVVGTVSGTSPTMTCKVQGSADGGANWIDIPGAATAALTATGVFGITVYPGVAVTAGTTTTGTMATASQILPKVWRVFGGIGGTTPSFTITSVNYAYQI